MEIKTDKRKIFIRLKNIREIMKELTLPDHTQLPESDGTFEKNGQEYPQSILLDDIVGRVPQRTDFD